MSIRPAYSTNAYRRCSAVEAIQRIGAIGYPGVELMADVPHAWPESTGPAECQGLREALTEAGCELSNINAFMMNAVQDFWHPSWIEADPAYRDLRVQHTMAALRMARRLGARCITTEPGGPLAVPMTREQAMDIFVAGLQQALQVAEGEGVLLLVEPEPGLLIENAEQFVELASQVNSPAFGLNFDVGHFYCVADPLPETVAKLAPWTRHYHIEDIAASRVHEHLVPGHGAIEFGPLFQAIHRTGYQGWVTVELYPYLDDPDGAGREALDFLRPHLNR